VAQFKATHRKKQQSSIKGNDNNQTDFANKANNAATNLNRVPL